MLPVLDIVALGIYRFSEPTAIAVAVVFPAIWLGLQYGRKGVIVTTVVVTVTFVHPHAAVPRPHPGWTRSRGSRR